MTDQILKDLYSMADPAYAEFQRKLIPNVEPDRVIGVRTPVLRSYAKKLYQSGDCSGFLEAVPHHFYEENNLHVLLLEQIREPLCCLESIERFLPHIDNWATCDMLRPKCLKRDKTALLIAIGNWLASDHTYTIRFGIEMLMVHFLQEDFRPAYPELASLVDCNKYYVNMMCAWYFATALAYHYDQIVPYLQCGKLTRWVHNKTIQKAVESDRISRDQKAYLRTLRR